MALLQGYQQRSASDAKLAKYDGHEFNPLKLGSRYSGTIST